MAAPSQIVYLSNRPDILRETLAYVRHFMPWLAEHLVLGPAATIRALDGTGVVGVAEEDLLTAAELRDRPREHSARNARLRELLAERGPLHDVFVQSDDDYRPLRAVGPEAFVDADGRLVSYFCHDLARWRRSSSTYDRAQQASYLAMSWLGGPHLQYGSHMPQAIDRQLYLDAFAAGARLDPTAVFCEWSLSLNHGRLVAPERFAAPRVFRTICWPDWPHEGWGFWRRPEDLAFENFHPRHYEPGGLFDGISTALDTADPTRQAFAKLRRWYAFDVEAGQLRFPADLADPWRTSPARRRFFELARRTRKLFEYVALEERTQLTELAGAVERLQQRLDER